MTKKNRVIVSLDKRTYDHLIELCEKKDSSKSHLVNFLIDEYYGRLYPRSSSFSLVDD